MRQTKTLLTAAAVASFLIPAAASAQQVGSMRAGGVSIATVPTHDRSAVQTVTADSSSHTNGRIWAQRGHLSGENIRPPLNWPEPGPAAYGAYEDDFGARVYARVGGILKEFSPWVRQTRMNSAGVQDRLELVRQQWLRRNGYTGGVRTVVNAEVTWQAPMPRAWDDGSTMEAEAQPASDVIRPRATIKIPDTRTKIRKKMMVDAASVIWSLPPTASPGLVAAVQPAVVASAD